jgi:drug/metabolite transporter (DMT)-like permease
MLKAFLQGLLLGLSYFFGFVAQTAGLKYTTATKSGFITGTFILYAPLFQYILQKKAPGKEILSGYCLLLPG